MDECKLIFMLLKEYLEQVEIDSELQKVLESVFTAIQKIALALRYGDAGKNGTENVFGEQQLKLDVLADQVLETNLRANALVGLVASEESDGEKKIGEGKYAVAYDPLDGSSLMDANLAVGTIAGVYETNSFIGVKGDEQLAALAAVYGPRTTVLLTVGKGVVEFTLNSEGQFVISKERLTVGEGKMFAPGNLKVASESAAYRALVDYWRDNQYTLRYSGGMVPDIAQILIKGKGIFAYPGSVKEPDGKLRLLFECAPMALLMEQAGGAASDGKQRILDMEVKSIEQTTPIYVGSKGEVKRCEESLG